MSKPEAAFWTRTVRPILRREAVLLGVKLHVERVENVVAVGTPDVDYCADAVAGKIELKYATRMPVRENTAVLGKGKGLRRSQLAWHYLRARSGGLSFVLIGAPGAMWLLPGNLPRTVLMGVETMNVAALEHHAVWTADDELPLLRALTGVRVV